MEIITVNAIAKIGSRLQMIKINLDHAEETLDGEELNETKALLETVNELLEIEVDFEGVEKVQKFIEENDGKITHLNEQATLKDMGLDNVGT